MAWFILEVAGQAGEWHEDLSPFATRMDIPSMFSRFYGERILAEKWSKPMKAKQGVDEDLLNDVVRRITEAVSPKRIILFGSAATLDRGKPGDLDLLIVMANGMHRRETSMALHRKLAGLGIAKDIVVVTEKDLLEHEGNPSLVLYPALREGREWYRAS